MLFVVEMPLTCRLRACRLFMYQNISLLLPVVIFSPLSATDTSLLWMTHINTISSLDTSWKSLWPDLNPTVPTELNNLNHQGTLSLKDETMNSWATLSLTFNVDYLSA